MLSILVEKKLGFHLQSHVRNHLYSKRYFRSILKESTDISTAANGCRKFLESSPSPFHAVLTCKTRLLDEGFTELKESQSWSKELKKGGKYYVTRNQSSIIAFTIGGEYQAGKGFKIAGAHTDSPCFLLKPKSVVKGQGYKQVAVQTYGGGLWHTWFDRDLSIAGKVVYETENGLEHTLVDLKKPILRIPNLAIHLQSGAEREAFKFDKEDHLVPMLCSEFISEKINGKSDGESPAHHPELLDLIAKEAGTSADKVLSFDLYLYDTHAPVIGGLYDEFLFSARIDNQQSCYSLIEAIGQFSRDDLEKDSRVSLVCMFDHEEVGSSSSSGAGGPFLVEVMKRIVGGFSPETDSFDLALRDSFNISVDGVHGVHPNYSSKHNLKHAPLMNKGPAIKYNANQRYATNPLGAALVKRFAKIADVPLQEICVKNSSPCGSTIGPITATLSGVTTVDLGNPMLSMHSIREQAGVVDCLHLTNLLVSFFKNFDAVSSVLID